MPFEVHWEPPRGAYKKFTGHLDDEQLVRSVTALHGDPRFDDLRYVINDFLEVLSYSITDDTIMYIAALDGAAARSNPGIRVALVISEAHEKALAARYAASPLNGYPTRIFNDVQEARAWAVQPSSP
ncbi:MAG TPA: hypothetical protein VF816_02895 [Rhodocyclaceae bacterium]